MLLFIVLALLLILTKSLFVVFVPEAGFGFDAVVVMAGLLSFIGMFGYIFWPQRSDGERVAGPRPDVSEADGHFEATDDRQDIAVHANRPMTGSALVRRLVRAKDDPAKQRIRAQLSELDDEQLFGLGLTSEEIAALRDPVDPSAGVIIAAEIAPPIAGLLLDATDDVWRPAGDTPRRERAARMSGG